jgi:hypothetical protein
MSRWFRFYDTALDDPKVQRLAPPLFKTWVNLLCVASRNGGALPEADLAFLLRLDGETMDDHLDRLEQAGLIDNDDGILTPHNWNARQFQSDTSAGRVKKHRDKRRNGDSNVTDTVTVTPPETDTDTDTSVASATGAEAPPLSPVDEIWVEQVPVLTSLSGAKETVVRQRVGKALSQFDPEAVRDAFAAAIAAKSGDPFAYATRVLIPNPKARGSPKQDCASAASDLAERLSDDTFAQPVVRPMLTAVRG